MKNLLIHILSFTLLFLIQPIFAAEPYQTYFNSRFNYSIEYPANLLIPRGEAANGDGQIFASADGQAQMTIYGAHNVFDQTLQELFRNESQNAVDAKITKQVTYKRMKNNWFVVSGYIGPKIFYQKTFLSNDMLKSFYIEYPMSQRKLFDPLVEQMGRSFKG